MMEQLGLAYCALTLKRILPRTYLHTQSVPTPLL
jgi:hypothetical protein